MATRMQQRRASAAVWSSTNPVLADGEIGYSKDDKTIKIGDGVTAWSDLPKVGGDVSVHETATDPHAQYLTSDEAQQVLEAKISRVGKTAGQIPTLQADGTLSLETVATGGGGTGVGTVDTRSHTGDVWEPRGTLPEGVVVLWIKRDATVPDPPIDATYMTVDDLLIGVTSAPISSSTSSGGFARQFLHGGY